MYVCMYVFISLFICLFSKGQKQILLSSEMTRVNNSPKPNVTALDNYEKTTYGIQ